MPASGSPHSAPAALGSAPRWRLYDTTTWLPPAALVALALALILVVEWRGRRMEITHRRTAERALAELAAFTLAERLQLSLAYAAERAIVPPTNGTVDSTFLRGMLLHADSVFACHCTALPRPEGTFAVSPAGHLTSTSSTAPLPMKGIVARLNASGPFGDAPVILSGVEDGRPWAALIKYHPDTTLRRALGVVVSTRSLTTDILPSAIAASRKAFPPSLTGGRSPVTYQLLTVAGPELAATGDSMAGEPHALVAARDSAFLVGARVAPHVGDFVVSTLRASSRLDSVLVGGLAALLTAVLASLAWRAAGSARFRNQFAVAAAHELRTPLTQVLMYGEMITLGRTRTPEELQGAAGIVVREARRMMAAVEGILHHTRAERREVRLTHQPVDAHEVIRQVLSDLAPLAATRHVALTADLLGHPWILADRTALLRVLSNLVDNGIKYGGHEVHVSTTDQGDRLDICVDDAGQGIPDTARKKVWRPFTRLPGDEPSPGAGLGLAIVAELVDALGGTASIEDAPLGGARFRVRLTRSLEANQ